jgi:predicted  nucleic acid-binding Zn-ribbon protein
MAKFKIKINDINNVRDLLQECYELADSQIIQAQNEINKLANSTRLQDEIMESKSKYAKAINDYLKIKNDAITRKLEISKLLTEIVKHNGSLEDTIKDKDATKGMSFDFSKIRDIVNNGGYDNSNKSETIQLKKK